MCGQVRTDRHADEHCEIALASVRAQANNTHKLRAVKVDRSRLTMSMSK